MACSRAWNEEPGTRSGNELQNGGGAKFSVQTEECADYRNRTGFPGYKSLSKDLTPGAGLEQCCSEFPPHVSAAPSRERFRMSLSRLVYLRNYGDVTEDEGQGEFVVAAIVRRGAGKGRGFTFASGSAFVRH
ncbi:hypothetical protein SRHO_G00328820 [Serrasalmus rhombeus]